MEISFKTIKQNTEAEIMEKKSKFIANLFYVETVEEAEQYINKIRKKFHNAKHHCFAYRVQKQETILEKSSDDKEPSGTAGVPMLQSLANKKLVNVLIIVTRYFGGILLGTGGLVKAYTNVTNKAIEKSKIVMMVKKEILKIVINYQNLEYFKYYCNKNEIPIIKIEYKEEVVCIIGVTLQEKGKILHEMKEKQFDIQKVELIKEQYISKNI